MNPIDNNHHGRNFLARRAPPVHQQNESQGDSPLRASYRLQSPLSPASNPIHSSAAPISTRNSAIFQRRQRRRLSRQAANSQQVEPLRRAALANARRTTLTRTASDSFSWIQRFVPSGTELEFSIFNVLLDRPELMLEVTKWLDVNDLISLYAISKDFHIMMNTQMTTMVLGNARSQAPECADIFRFTCYQSLCIYDPAQNRNETPKKEHMVRSVPGLRWLRFIQFREQTVTSILEGLAARGQRLPRIASKVIKKVWFLMDISDTQRRIATVRNPDLWSEVELYIACMFFMKLDMACSDPVDGNGEKGLRRLLLAQRSLSKLDAVLKREELWDFYELMQMHVEWKLNRAQMPPGMYVSKTVFGVFLKDCGRLSCKNWKPSLITLMRVDEVIMRESVRRGLNFDEKLIDLVIWGNIHPATSEDVFPKNKLGEIQTTFDPETEREALQQMEMHASNAGTRFNWDGKDDGVLEDEETGNAMLIGSNRPSDMGSG